MVVAHAVVHLFEVSRIHVPDGKDLSHRHAFMNFLPESLRRPVSTAACTGTPEQPPAVEGAELAGRSGGEAELGVTFGAV